MLALAKKQFLIDIEFDARPTLSTNGKGVKLTPEMRSQITDKMGELGGFGRAIREVMKHLKVGHSVNCMDAALVQVFTPYLLIIKTSIVCFVKDCVPNKRYAMSLVELAPEIAELDTQNQIEEATRLGQIERIRQLQNN